jgi:hypothetical protein
MGWIDFDRIVALGTGRQNLLDIDRVARPPQQLPPVM